MNSPSLPQLERTPLASRTGRGVRIAVIDSGVNSRHPHIVGLAGGLSIKPGGEVEEGAYSDVLGHGTAVMAAIQEKAPEAEYYAVKVFHASLRTSAECLLMAIEWAIDKGMDVVNLSLGTRNPEHAPKFDAVIARAKQQGVLLVAARDVDQQLCLPGSLPGVVGVGLDWEIPREQYRYAELPAPVYFTSGYPRSLPGVPRERNLNGISFAVANMTGFVARACEANAEAGEVRSLDRISRVLREESTATAPVL